MADKNRQLPKTIAADLVWPAIPHPEAALLVALQYQLEQSQWLSAESLQELQFYQLGRLLRHAVETVPFYRELFTGVEINSDLPLTMERWLQLPILERDVLQDRQQDLISNTPLLSHGGWFEKKTSGSTGGQLTIKDTDANNLYFMALTLRDHLWHRRNFGGRYVSIRSGRAGKDPMTVNQADTWDWSTSSIFPTGPTYEFFHTMPIDKQAELLCSMEPEYLLIYPSNAIRLTQYFRKHGLSLPTLREVITYGELLFPEVRQDCREVWNVPVSDMYSCEEVGYGALQCPDFEHYHCQSESVLLEVLNAQGRPCVPGEVGRVVLTSLHNFAMPLIRYSNQDYAEVGAACSCGRGAPVINRFLGRERNRAVRLDGERFWPNVSRDVWSAVDRIEELQLVQVSRTNIEIRLVRDETLSSSQERQLADLINEALAQSYTFSFGYQKEIIRHANGKYERFICNVD